ncbi:MAG: hypothetical protein HKN30_17790 [Sulfitobacter sp.]|nr:hypothetical protein [Sulfitobacter sp.]
MSAILLNNPFVTPSQPSSPPPEVAPPLTVTPAQIATSSRDSGGATSFSGSGTGSGDSRQGDTAALLRSVQKKSVARPPDATGASVVNAQGSGYGSNLPKVEMPDPLPTSPFLKRN